MKVTIRKSEYRCKQGFTVSCPFGAVFTETREQAEALRDVLKWQLPFKQHVWAMQAILLVAR